jgi:hypothetical protein
MTDIDALVNAYSLLAVNSGSIVPAIALNGTSGFNNGMNDGMFLGNWATAKTAGQVTLGTRLGNIGDIVRDLHDDPNETGLEKTDRDPGRLHMRPADAVNAHEPRALGGMDEANTLVNGHTLAQNTLAQYQAAHATAPGGSALEGLLTIIFTYTESMQHKTAFLKNHTPLMAKTNLAVMFSTLPNNEQQYYSKKKWGKSNFERLIETAPGYAAKMGRPLFDGVSGIYEDDKGHGQTQWYHKLTLKSWLRSIILQDRSLWQAIQGSAKPLGSDKLTDASFPKKPADQEVEGYGALGVNMDTHAGTGDDLPVFELRSANKLITYAQAHQWALDFFDYVQSLNDNPGGGHTRMT